jgi:flavin reductase (DIM6/NTAB) family NADH-FMN oxidoreductase RutF
MKQDIVLFDYASEITKALQKGVLITAKAGERTNPMTISWGTLGIQWNRPIFTTFVRESRFTKSLLDQNGEFTVNIPQGGDVAEILRLCGSQSGRDVDKVAALGLTLTDSKVISVPGIKELPLTLECRVIYKQPQDLDALAQTYRDSHYPPLPDIGRDHHTAYYGEVVAAYILK